MEKLIRRIPYDVKRAAEFPEIPELSLRGDPKQIIFVPETQVKTGTGD